MLLIKECTKDKDILKSVEILLNSLGLKIPQNIDYAISAYEGQKLIGCGFLVGDILQGIGVNPDYKGEGISALIVTELMKKALELGKEHLFIYTKPREVQHFTGLGFKKVAEAVPYSALLEWGHQGIGKYKELLKDLAGSKPAAASCVVVNCNPFTLGHRRLIEKAAQASPWLYIIVVEEDSSLFPFQARFNLVKKGTADLSNVTVLPGGKYVISYLTFPAYFTRESDLAAAQASLDLEIFANHIAPSLKVIKRYVGEEPYCTVTAEYNHCMKSILPRYGISIDVVQRAEIDGQPVSASRVRQLIREDRIDEIKRIVPDSTFRFLLSPEAQEIVKKIKHTKSRH